MTPFSDSRLLHRIMKTAGTESVCRFGGSARMVANAKFANTRLVMNWPFLHVRSITENQMMRRGGRVALGRRTLRKF